MKKDDRFPLDIEALRSHLSRMSRASLRITEDLDLDVALQEIRAIRTPAGTPR